jgi:dTDP-4-dehydrorhamnose reductase
LNGTTTTKPRLLVVGASGYLGRYLAARAGDAWNTAGTHLTSAPPAGIVARALDLRHRPAVRDLLLELRPAVVLHAAYRRDDPSVTVAGTDHLTNACATVGARLVFVSTDLVFDGRRGWYRESDPTGPLDAYGASKVEAERIVLAHGGVVARTSLIYGFEPLDDGTRRLVVEPIRRGERPKLFVDEFRCPVFAPDLADALLELAAGDFQGLLHLAGPQRLSRYDFGLKLATALGLDAGRIKPSRIVDSGLARPPDCSLHTGLARRILRTHLRSVDEAVAGFSQRS